MKIVILANNDVGLYQFRNELIGELLKKNQVFISLPKGDLVEPLRQLGCKFINTSVDRRGINPKTDFSLFLKYMKILRKINPNLVITYTIKPNIYGGFACRLLKIPYATNITGLGTAFQSQGMLRKLVTVMYKVSLKKAKVVFFENCGNQKVFVDEKIVPKSKTCLLNGAGVNLEHYAYVEYPKDSEETRFLFVGRVMKEKGVDELFKAMRQLRKNSINCSLDVLGGYEENYENVIRRFEEEGWLRYHGYQEDVRPFIANCHCFVLPSWHEGMANTNLECAASGRPVVTSNIYGCLEAVIDGESGFLCEKQNAQSLFISMKKIVELPIEVRAEMGKIGREHMIKHFDKRKVVSDTVAALGIKE